MSTLQRTFEATTPQRPGGPLNATHHIGRSLVRHVSHEICGQITGKPELSETHSQFLVGRLQRSNFSQARLVNLPIADYRHLALDGVRPDSSNVWLLEMSD